VTQYGDLGPTKFNTAIKSLTIMASSGELVSSKTLEDELGVESSFIRKVLTKLMNAGMLEAVGGRYGGYKLLADPARTTVYEVYVALSKDSYIKEQVLLANKTDRLIAQIITEAEIQFSKVLGKYTIADLAATMKAEE